MAQYINKSTIVAEIEKFISNGKIKCKQSQENNYQESYIAWSEHIATCRKILSFINTLEVKEMEDNVIDGNVIEDIEEGNGDFLLNAEYLPKSMGLKDGQKVKIIIVKEE